MPDILHATLVADWQGGRWRGALVTGASGRGKSTLALRTLELGFRLVADDRVIAWRSGEALYGKAPKALAGLMEVRGVGVLAGRPKLELCSIDLAAELAQGAERSPDPAQITILGTDLPRICLGLEDADAALRLRVALAAAQHRL